MSTGKDYFKWSSEKTLQFIELYHNKPMWYKLKNSNYFSKFSKNDIWEKLATIMDISSYNCKLKTNSWQSSFC